MKYYQLLFYVRSYNYICFLPLVPLRHGIGKCQHRRLSSFSRREKDPALYRFYYTKCYYPFPIRLLSPVSLDIDLDSTKFLVGTPCARCFCKNSDPQQFTEKYIVSKNVFACSSCSEKLS